MFNFQPLLIHKDNTPIKNICTNSLKFDIDNFDFETSDLDTYISTNFIPKLLQKDFNIIFIKDNLSDNYLELYGLLLAYHIRLSEELKDKRYVPIVIISDVDAYILNKLSPLANILFTKNTFIAKNEVSSFDYFQKVFKQLTPFTDFHQEFISKIKIEPPKDYLSDHDISNEWAIYRWAKELEIQDSNSVNIILKKISSLLFFKYLKAKYDILEDTKISKKGNFVIPRNKLKVVKRKEAAEKKVLYIDDEYAKGWKDIFNHIFSKKRGYEFGFVDMAYKDKTYEDIKPLIYDEITSFEPDLIILDMRLIQDDHKKDIDPKNISGMKILEMIKTRSLNNDINPATLVIILSATNRSDILEEAYKDNKILGYVKKDHIDEKLVSTGDNIDKFSDLLKDGEDKFYLKEIWDTQKQILQLNIFKKEKYNEIKKELSFILDILDSNMENNLKFAMLTIYKILEIIKDLYVDEQAKYLSANQGEIRAIFLHNGNYQAITKNTFINEYRQYNFNERKDSTKYYYSTTNKIRAIVYEVLNLTDNSLLDTVENISAKRNKYIHPDRGREIIVEKKDIIEWLDLLKEIICKIDNIAT